MDSKRVIIVLVILVVYVGYMVFSALLRISGGKENDTLKSKLQKQDMVGGVVTSVEFSKTAEQKRLSTRAMVEHDGGRYPASVPPETKIGDEIRILLHEGYAIHSSFRDDPLPHLHSAGHRRSNNDFTGFMLLLFGATFGVSCLLSGAMYLYAVQQR